MAYEYSSNTSNALVKSFATTKRKDYGIKKKKISTKTVTEYFIKQCKFSIELFNNIRVKWYSNIYILICRSNFCVVSVTWPLHRYG